MQFDEANRPCDAMTFGLAIEAAKKGLKIARKGWNGKGMFVFHCCSTGWTILFGNTTDYKNQPTLMMKTAQDMYVPWLASQTDMLAEDWEVVT